MRALGIVAVVLLSSCNRDEGRPLAIEGIESSLANPMGSSLTGGDAPGESTTPTWGNALVDILADAASQAHCSTGVACRMDNAGTAGADGDCWTTQCTGSGCTGAIWTDAAEDYFENVVRDVDFCQSEADFTITLPAVVCVRQNKVGSASNRWHFAFDTNGDFFPGSRYATGAKMTLHTTLGGAINSTTSITSTLTNWCYLFASGSQDLWYEGSSEVTDTQTIDQTEMDDGFSWGNRPTSSSGNQHRMSRFTVWENTDDITTAAALYQAWR